MAQDTLDLDELSNRSHLWVFGYGSILWKTGFRYSSRRVGHVHGFVRRFWQGNITHRGTPKSPGRVATLVASGDQKDKVWGMAFELNGAKKIRKALEHLGLRECTLGGYCTSLVSFHMDKCLACSNSCSGCDNTGPCNSCRKTDTIQVLVFTASSDNEHYLGPAPTADLALQIVSSKGSAGHNVEYVLRLAEYVRETIPQDEDSHLFDLEQKIRSILKQRNICAENLIVTHRPIRMTDAPNNFINETVTYS